MIRLLPKRLKLRREAVQPRKTTIHVTSRLLRTSTWVLTYLLFKFGLYPNLVSLMSIFAGLFAGVFAMKGELFIFSLLCLLWAVLDCCDGELARLIASRKGITDTSGSVIELINSNIQYALWIPSIAIGQFIEGTISLEVLIFSVCSSITYSASRVVMNFDIPKQSDFGSKLKVFFISQTKNGDHFRDGKIGYKIIYIFWRNALTQFGIFPLVWLFSSLNPTVLPPNLVLMFFTFSYAAFSICVLSAIVIYTDSMLRRVTR